MSKKQTKTTEKAHLQEIAQTINPLGLLIKKNQQRVEKKSEKSLKLRDARLPLPGAVLERQYKGNLVSVKVLESGFEYESKYYKTLSAVAVAITGHHISGYHFFGL